MCSNCDYISCKDSVWSFTLLIILLQCWMDQFLPDGVIGLDQLGVWGRHLCVSALTQMLKPLHRTHRRKPSEQWQTNWTRLHVDETCRCVCSPLPDTKAIVAFRLNCISYLHGSARALFSLGEARPEGQKIHFMSSGEQMLCKVSFTPQWLFRAFICEQTAQISTVLPQPDRDSSLINLRVWKQVLQ